MEKIADEPVPCVNWYQFYNECRAGEINPHKGAINFDNIGYAWIAIFQVTLQRDCVQEYLTNKHAIKATFL